MPPSGERNGRVKLTDEQVLKLAGAYQRRAGSGMTYKQLAGIFGAAGAAPAPDAGAGIDGLDGAAGVEGPCCATACAVARATTAPESAITRVVRRV